MPNSAFLLNTPTRVSDISAIRGQWFVVAEVPYRIPLAWLCMFDESDLRPCTLTFSNPQIINGEQKYLLGKYSFLNPSTSVKEAKERLARSRPVFEILAGDAEIGGLHWREAMAALDTLKLDFLTIDATEVLLLDDVKLSTEALASAVGFGAPSLEAKQRLARINPHVGADLNRAALAAGILPANAFQRWERSPEEARAWLDLLAQLDTCNLVQTDTGYEAIPLAPGYLPQPAAAVAKTTTPAASAPAAPVSPAPVQTAVQQETRTQAKPAAPAPQVVPTPQPRAPAAPAPKPPVAEIRPAPAAPKPVPAPQIQAPAAPAAPLPVLTPLSVKPLAAKLPQALSPVLDLELDLAAPSPQLADVAAPGVDELKPVEASPAASLVLDLDLDLDMGDPQQESVVPASVSAPAVELVLAKPVELPAALDLDLDFPEPVGPGPALPQGVSFAPAGAEESLPPEAAPVQPVSEVAEEAPLAILETLPAIEVQLPPAAEPEPKAEPVSAMADVVVPSEVHASVQPEAEPAKVLLEIEIVLPAVFAETSPAAQPAEEAAPAASIVIGPVSAAIADHLQLPDIELTFPLTAEGVAPEAETVPFVPAVTASAPEALPETLNTAGVGLPEIELTLPESGAKAEAVSEDAGAVSAEASVEDGVGETLSASEAAALADEGPALAVQPEPASVVNRPTPALEPEVAVAVEPLVPDAAAAVQSPWMPPWEHLSEEQRESIAQNIENCRQLARALLQRELDFDEDAVHLLDEMAEFMHKTGAKTDNLGPALVLASFLGECVQRRFGGEWALYKGDLCIRYNQENGVFPVSRVIRQIESGRFGGDSITALFEEQKALLGRELTPMQRRFSGLFKVRPNYRYFVRVKRGDKQTWAKVRHIDGPWVYLETQPLPGQQIPPEISERLSQLTEFNVIDANGVKLKLAGSAK
jgi:hypothetical protein